MSCVGFLDVVLQSDDNPLDYRIRSKNNVLMLQHQTNGDCIHLVDGKCEVHSKVPEACRNERSSS